MANIGNMVISILKEIPDQKLTARQLAQKIIAQYPSDLATKRDNPRFKTDKDFESQIVAEIGSSLPQIRNKALNIHTRDKPRPRLYYWSKNDNDESGTETVASEKNEVNPPLSEHELYPLLIEYLSAELQLFSLRIDEKRSKNSKGSGGNHWLHPDIVSMQPLDQNWQDNIRACVKEGNGQAVRLWSFEVKKEITRGNVRQCFFQAVSNSSWANFGYLVATGIRDNVEQELQMLSALHGIGVLLLDTEDIFNSQVLIPAKEKPEVDWQSANRIVTENRDFKDFIELVSIYYQTGKLREREWNRV